MVMVMFKFISHQKKRLIISVAQHLLFNVCVHFFDNEIVCFYVYISY